MSTVAPPEPPTRPGTEAEWIELDPPEDEEPVEGRVPLMETWVTPDPIDDLLAGLRTGRVRLSQPQIMALNDILGGWAREEDVMSERAVQEGIDEAIREFEEWKDSLPG